MTDFVVVGGGIAGVSAAAHLAPHGSVVLLEAESSLAYHTTGRSAAVFVVNYGAHGTRPMAVASRTFLENPPEGSTDNPILSDRGLLWIATDEQLPQLEKMAATATTGAGSVVLTAAEATELLPVLRPERVAGAMWEEGARDIDVAGLHQALVRIARRHGAEIRTGAPVTEILDRSGTWVVVAGGETIMCDVVVNAAGAWGDVVAARADVAPIGLQPRRRTAFMVPGDESYKSWPMTVDVDHRFYFKPDGTQILCSLAEEEPSDPGDPKPRVEDVALAIERINEATTLDIRTVNSAWTGLRTFAPDGNLVVGEDPTAPGFYWLVGQGGIGIATSPAYGSLLASLVLGVSPSTEILAAGVDPTVLSPARFR